MLYIRKGGEHVDEEKETPEKVPFAQAKEELMNILYDTPESTDTEKSGIVEYSCVINTETNEIVAKGGFAGEVRSCMVGVACLISELSKKPT